MPYSFDPNPTPAGHVTHRITISGGDQLGLVARLAEVFRQYHANIVRLEARKLSDERAALRHPLCGFAETRAGECLPGHGNEHGGHAPPHAKERSLSRLPVKAEVLKRASCGQRRMARRLGMVTHHASISCGGLIEGMVAPHDRTRGSGTLLESSPFRWAWSPMKREGIEPMP